MAPVASPARVAIRAAEVAALGDIRSNGRQSQPGNVSTGVSGEKNANAACISHQAPFVTGDEQHWRIFAAGKFPAKTKRASKPSGAPESVMWVCFGMDASPFRQRRLAAQGADGQVLVHTEKRGDKDREHADDLGADSVTHQAFAQVFARQLTVANDMC